MFIHITLKKAVIRNHALSLKSSRFPPDPDTTILHFVPVRTVRRQEQAAVSKIQIHHLTLFCNLRQQQQLY